MLQQEQSEQLEGGFIRPTQPHVERIDNAPSVQTVGEVGGDDDTISVSTDHDNDAESLDSGSTDGDHTLSPSQYLPSDLSDDEDRTVQATPHTHSDTMKRSDGGTRKCSACVRVYSVMFTIVCFVLCRWRPLGQHAALSFRVICFAAAMRLLLKRVSSTLISVGNLSDLMVTNMSTLMAMARNTDAAITQMKGEMQEMCAQIAELKQDSLAGAAVAPVAPVAAPVHCDAGSWELPIASVQQLKALNNRLRSSSFRRQMVIIVHNLMFESESVISC